MDNFSLACLCYNLTNFSTEKRPLERHRRRREDNIRMDLKEIDINTRDWVDSAQEKDYWRALVNVALNLRVPYAMELEFIAGSCGKLFKYLDLRRHRVHCLCLIHIFTYNFSHLLIYNIGPSSCFLPVMIVNRNLRT